MIELECDSCERVFQVLDREAGGKVPCPMCGDVNCDDTVDAVDAMFILQYVVGLRGELCVCP